MCTSRGFIIQSDLTPPITTCRPTKRRTCLKNRPRPYHDFFTYPFLFLDQDPTRKSTDSGGNAAPSASPSSYESSIAEIALVVIRVPTIPTINAFDEEFINISTLAKTLKGVDTIHILPYHVYGENKYKLIGREDDFKASCWRRHTTGSMDVMGRLRADRPSVTIRTEFFKPEKGHYLHPTEVGRAHV